MDPEYTPFPSALGVLLPMAERSPEGWVIVRTEVSEADPVVFDDNYHRGPVRAYWVRGTGIWADGSPYDRARPGGGDWGALDAVVGRLRAAGLGQMVYEEVGPDGPGYRVIRTI
jgi:hypothetical protein